MQGDIADRESHSGWSADGCSDTAWPSRAWRPACCWRCGCSLCSIPIRLVAGRGPDGRLVRRFLAGAVRLGSRHAGARLLLHAAALHADARLRPHPAPGGVRAARGVLRHRQRRATEGRAVPAAARATRWRSGFSSGRQSSSRATSSCKRRSLSAGGPKQALEELAGRLIHAQEEERSRIGRELHDHISQMLGVLTIKIDQLRADRRMPRRPSADALDELRHGTPARSPMTCTACRIVCIHRRSTIWGWCPRCRSS